MTIPAIPKTGDISPNIRSDIVAIDLVLLEVPGLLLMSVLDEDFIDIASYSLGA